MLFFLSGITFQEYLLEGCMDGKVTNNCLTVHMSMYFSVVIDLKNHPSVTSKARAEPVCVLVVFVACVSKSHRNRSSLTGNKISTTYF